MQKIILEGKSLIFLSVPVIQRNFVMEANDLQTKLRVLHQEGRRFDIDVVAFKRPGDPVTVWQSESGNKVSTDIRVILDLHKFTNSSLIKVSVRVRPLEVDGCGFAFLFHWTNKRCPTFGVDQIQDEGRYRLKQAIPHFFPRSKFSRYQIRVDMHSVIEAMN